ncbi:hypothetical protein KC332_g15215 [Hortaea werneckii]|uniref:NIMA interactive protein n=1 Tax=Hortaea werneckii TaxID=91943 RepID=A0A3M7IU86_HORWE|nr:hypothetical protein KC358_g10372 [Hortaea werneckii]KAI6821300.1 hypothetical protein KC350_g9632 [Hortaea werneckii]KAI6918684.1 hypothetical protein KC348_g10850 [Hortaea werneckii]KAI6929987.1 hypothetical protein KC341_g10515 [Hortaea werneckii]KAI6962836.1 hypothetical protein KC329_g16188 [Hortaea werneckii]
MDHDTLRTASNYLNNLLLARGLLRNSEPIDFVKPSKDTRAQIINLVHDLILHQDRDKDNREHVAITLRNLRADDGRKTGEIEKLKEKNEELARTATQAQAAQRAAETEAKKVEKSIKSLQDQAAKLKTTLAQVKTQCTNDIRKRDLELNRLKAHLQGQQRGNKVVPPSAGLVGGGIRGNRDGHQEQRELEDPAYSLKQETTEFLTQLSQGLSEENDQLISIIHDGVGDMRELLGLQPYQHRMPDSAIGSLGSNASRNKHAAPTSLNSYEILAADMQDCLAHLKPILSNPNFVTVEEVEIREEEIARLRQGWEHMEKRWRDVLLMMEGWRRRMDTGETINLDDLTRGLGLVSPVRPPHIASRDIEHREEPEQSLLGANEEEEDASEIQLPDSDPAYPEQQDETMMQDADGQQDNNSPPPPPPPHHSPTPRTTRSTRRSSRHNPTVTFANNNSSNGRSSHQPSPHKPTASTPPKRKRATETNILEPPAFFDLRPSSHKSAPTPSAFSPQHLPQPTPAGSGEADFEEGEEEEEEASYEDGITVEVKLRLAQEEAEEVAIQRQQQQRGTEGRRVQTSPGKKARTSALSASASSTSRAQDTNGPLRSSHKTKISSERRSKNSQAVDQEPREKEEENSGEREGNKENLSLSPSHHPPKGPRTAAAAGEGDQEARDDEDDTLGQIPLSAVKRTKIKGRPMRGRRKSTLNPAELEELLMGGGGGGDEDGF